jgi:hypothetical protein
MLQPGQCTLPPDESGRILDRLAGLEQIIPPEAVRQALAKVETGNSATRPSDKRQTRRRLECILVVVSLDGAALFPIFLFSSREWGLPQGR